jgi:hypothetical protein
MKDKITVAAFLYVVFAFSVLTVGILMSSGII